MMKIHNILQKNSKIFGFYGINIERKTKVICGIKKMIKWRKEMQNYKIWYKPNILPKNHENSKKMI